MTSENSVDFAFGQVIFSLKSSKLNYIVNETPYSGYITIRKKFIKNKFDAPEKYVPEVIRVESNVKKENLELKEKVKDLGIMCAQLRFENEEMEVNNETLNKEIVSLEDKLEDAYLEARNLKKEVDNINEDKRELIDKLSEKREKLTF